MRVRRATARTTRAGLTKGIVRASYNTKNGYDVRNSWYDTIRAVEQRSGGRCEDRDGGQRCTNKAREVHHIVPLSRGGTNAMLNLIHVCQACHDRKHKHLWKARTLKRRN